MPQLKFALLAILVACLGSCERKGELGSGPQAEGKFKEDRYEEPSAPSFEEVNLSEREIIEASGVAPQDIGYIVYDLESRTIRSQHNAGEFFLPASVIKVLSTFYALENLGPDFRFTTRMTYDGKIEEGVLQGNLYLNGDGDPFLTASDLMGFAAQLKQLGIRKVNGGFFLSDETIGSLGRIDRRANEDQPYNPAVSGLSVDFNQLMLHWGDERRAFLIPEVPFQALKLNPRKNSNGNLLRLRSGAKRDVWILSADRPARGVERLPVLRPTEFTGFLLRRFAGMLGCKLPKPKLKKMPATAISLHVHRSPPLVELAGATLEYSNNLIAELLWLRAVSVATSKKLSFQNAGHETLEWLKKIIPEMSWKGMRLANGSGLSAQTRLTPEQMLVILGAAEGRRYFGRPFWTFLPVMGWKRRNGKRLGAPPTAFRIWAKGGHLDFVANLSGVGFSREGKKFLFVLFMTDRKNPKIAESHPAGAQARTLASLKRKWVRKAHELQDALLSRWIFEL